MRDIQLFGEDNQEVGWEKRWSDDEEDEDKDRNDGEIDECENGEDDSGSDVKNLWVSLMI